MVRLLTDIIELITDWHKRVIIDKTEFYDRLRPLITAISEEMKRDIEQEIQVK